MPFVKLPGIEGWVYEPEIKPGSQKKHNCPDCFYCQMCSDTRCQMCQKGKVKQREKNTKTSKKD